MSGVNQIFIIVLPFLNLIIMIKQRTKEWYSSRIGKFTASGFSNLMARPRDKSATWSKSALNYIEKAAAQIYHNDYYIRPDSDATRWGMDHEAQAIREFNEHLSGDISETGFLEHPEIKDIGATPDAFVVNDAGEKAIVQVKCPYNQENHRKYLEKISDGNSLKKSKSQYYWQIQGEIWVTGVDFGYFVSFDPRIHGSERLHFVKIDRDEEAINYLRLTVLKSIAKRNEILQQFNTGIRYPKELDEYWGG